MSDEAAEPKQRKSGAGKGSAPRNLSKRFLEHYPQIRWPKRPEPRPGLKFRKVYR